MGTSASIICHTGSYTWANDVHYDGDLSHVGLLLVNAYPRLEVIQPLVHGGSMSGLAAMSGYPALDDDDREKMRMAEIMRTHHDRPYMKNLVSVYYHRDKKEPWDLCKYRTYNSLAEAIKGETCDYVYVWHEPTQRWYWANCEQHPRSLTSKILAARQPVVGVPLSIALEHQRKSPGA